MGDRLGIPRVVDSTYTFFPLVGRAPAVEQRNHLLFSTFLRFSTLIFTFLYRFSAYWLRSSVVSVPPKTFRPLPTLARRIPKTFRRIPKVFRPLPTSFRRIPKLFRRIPKMSRPFPKTLRRLPTTARPVPTTLRRLPMTPDHHPNIAHHSTYPPVLLIQPPVTTKQLVRLPMAITMYPLCLESKSATYQPTLKTVPKLQQALQRMAITFYPKKQKRSPDRAARAGAES